MYSDDVSLLSYLKQYLQDGDDAVLKACRKRYKKNLSLLHKDYRRTKIDFQEVEDILATLAIESSPYKKLSSEPRASRVFKSYITPFDFLKEVNLQLEAQERSSEQTILIKRFNRFNDLIAAIENSKKDKILFFSLLILLCAIAASPVIVSQGATIIEVLLAFTAFIPVGSLLFTSGIALYSFYQTTQDKRLSFGDKFRDNFFLLAKTALNVIAYSILIAGATSLHPITGFLFVAASGVMVVREIVRMVQLGREIKNLGSCKNNDSLEKWQEIIRASHEYSRLTRSIGIDLLAAVAVVAIVAAWCFIPQASLFVSVGAVAAIGAVYVGTKIAKHFNTKWSRENLVKKFTAVKERHEREVGIELQEMNFDDLPGVAKPQVLNAAHPRKTDKAVRNRSNSYPGFFKQEQTNDGNTEHERLMPDATRLSWS